MSNNKTKEFAKAGMVVSLMVTTGTTFFLDNKKVKYLHIASGVALLGFSFWHHSLYKKEPGRLKREARRQITRQEKGA
ncbi:MAG: hypothetical protein DRH21_06100 [Deltaproteobacteria bacterium]|nr:MAG: hypothetical protein DRH21_06100 [Deltaproteobacteria bacterium]